VHPRAARASRGHPCRDAGRARQDLLADAAHQDSHSRSNPPDLGWTNPLAVGATHRHFVLGHRAANSGLAASRRSTAMSVRSPWRRPRSRAKSRTWVREWRPVLRRVRARARQVGEPHPREVAGRRSARHDHRQAPPTCGSAPARRRWSETTNATRLQARKQVEQPGIKCGSVPAGRRECPASRTGSRARRRVSRARGPRGQQWWTDAGRATAPACSSRGHRRASDSSRRNPGSAAAHRRQPDVGRRQRDGAAQEAGEFSDPVVQLCPRARPSQGSAVPAGLRSTRQP